ncbi:MAG: general secretion pathway protein A [Flavobacterium sp.]|jgi:general secretion pathway protein A
MYYDYFGLREPPFSIAPNPQYLYMSERHRDALAHLLYGIQSDGGFLLLTGEVGTGKTTVCRCLLNQVPADVDTAYILNPKLTAQELLATICDDFHIQYPENCSIKILVDRLNTFLLESNKADRRTVLIIDEAQNLSIDVLEQLRLLTNLETNHRKLLQIILLGQPELLSVLAQPELRQLSQRVTARFHLSALNLEEVAAYIQYRLEVAGAKGILFPPKSVRRIYKISKGIPRLINLISDRALLGTYVQNQLEVQVDTINKAATEILGASKPKISAAHFMLTLLLTTFMSIGLAYYYQDASKLDGIREPSNELGQFPAKIQMPPSKVLSNNVDIRVNPIPESNYVLIEDIKGVSQKTEIYTELFSMWNINVVLNVNSNPCQIARISDLQCYEKVGNLHEISQINRPALITLNDEYFIINNISNQNITLRAKGTSFLVNRTHLLGRWDGVYALLWRFPAQYKRHIGIGDDGITAQFLQDRLLANGSDPSSFIQFKFDSHLEESVKRFQLTTGLVPDGIVGPQTWIHLNSRLDNNIPLIVKVEI